MGSIVTFKRAARFGVMYIESKVIIGYDGCQYGFGEAPEMSMAYDVAQAQFSSLLDQGWSENDICLFMYSPDELNEGREPFPVIEDYYAHVVRDCNGHGLFTSEFH